MALPEILAELTAVVGKRWVRNTQRDRLAYAYDATGIKYLPDVVVFPGSTAEVAGVLAVAHRGRIPVVPRGAGTNVSGGTVPIHGGIVMAMQRLNRIVDIDPISRRATVEPNVTNLALQEALQPHGFFYAPDPSSHRVSTIGGNCQENAGGPRCLKYGVTTNHVHGIEMVLAGGRVLTLGGEAEDYPGLDLVGLVVGAEGTLGVITKVTVKILPLPDGTTTILAVFDDLEACARAVSDMIAHRLVPAALELMDGRFMRIIQASMDAGLPTDAAGALIIEVDGFRAGLSAQAAQVAAICREWGVRTVDMADTPARQQALWRGRRAAYGCLARKSSRLWSMDITVPRGRLAEMIHRAYAAAERYQIELYCVAHAGDGNLHPCTPIDSTDPDQQARVLSADREILQACVELGGSITGEHGVGIEKLEQTKLMFGPAEFSIMQELKQAFDPDGVMNPGKKIPLRAGGI